MRKPCRQFFCLDESRYDAPCAVAIKFLLSKWLAGLSLAIFIALFPVSASARSLFELVVESKGEIATKGFSDFEQIGKQLDNSGGLQQLFPDYTENSPANAVIDARGLKMLASYHKYSPALHFQVPCSGIDMTFWGETRDESQELLLDFLRGKSSSAANEIYRGFSKCSPVDPVAGNPNSLVAEMAANNFRVGSITDAGQVNLLDMGAGFARSDSDGFKTNIVSFRPINYVYTIPASQKPPYALIIDFPVRYLDIEGGDVFDGSLGIGARIPVLNNWALTPMFRVGGVGSINTGSFQGALLGSVSSKVDFYLDDLRLSVNNMIAYSSTIGITAGDYQTDYDIQNGIFRNGLALEGSLNFKLLDQPTSWELSYIDTRVTGDSWFYDWWNEAVISVGTRRRATRMVWQDIRLGFSYAFSDDFNRWQIGLDYRF